MNLNRGFAFDCCAFSRLRHRQFARFAAFEFALVLPQGIRGMPRALGGEPGWSAAGNQLSSGGATFGADINQPVSRAYHIQIVLNNQQRMPGIHQFAEGF